MRKGFSPGNAVCTVHRKFILKQLRNGKQVTQIAAELGVTQPAISISMASRPDYRLARELGHRKHIIILARALKALKQPTKKDKRPLKLAVWHYLADFGVTEWAIEHKLAIGPASPKLYTSKKGPK